jgi:superfamily II DNA or RNA helicase
MEGGARQYIGRLHRLHPGKREAFVYDYIDEAVPVLKRMSEKRVRGLQEPWLFDRLVNSARLPVTVFVGRGTDRALLALPTKS